MNKLKECGNVVYPFNHGMSPIVDDKGYVVKPTNASYAYWSASDGSISCPNWRDHGTSSMEEYWIICTILIISRAYTNMLQLKIARFLMNKRKNEGKGNRIDNKHQLCFGLPLTTVFELCHGASFIIMVLILGLIPNANPIYIFFGFTLSIECYFVGMGLSCLKMVRLGQRILPKSMRGDKVMDNSITHDPFLLLFFTTLIVCGSLAAVLQLLVAPITGDIRYCYYGIFFFGIATQSGALILGRQGMRVINYMKESNKLVKGNISVSVGDGSDKVSANKKRQDQINRVISRMTFRSLVMVLIGTPAAVIAILAGAGITKFYWYTMITFGYCCAISSFSSSLMFIPRGMSMIPCVPDRAVKDSDQQEQINEGDNVTEPSSNKMNNAPAKQNQITTISSPNDANKNSLAVNEAS